jgi:putative molybdopterin biosynthesis protein
MHSHAQRTSLENARDLVCAHATVTAAERIDVGCAAGRVTAEPVRARFAAPHYRASAMDGIAVRARDTAGAHASPVVLSPGGDPMCAPVDTGSPLPDWADAVVRIEDTRAVGAGYELRVPVAPGRDVRRIGEDVEAGAIVVGSGRTLGPHEVGALLATGVAHVMVRRPPRLAVIATGAEVIEPCDGAVPAPGQVIEYNSRVLAAYARGWGAETVSLGRAADDAGQLAGRVREAVRQADALCIIAGSSAGRKDTSVAALESCGELVFRGVEVMPGKPAAFAVVDAKPVFVIPGYPVSAAVIYRELVGAWVDAALGRAHAHAPTIRAVVRRKIASRLGVEELLRVCLAFDDKDFVVAPLPRGAGSISTLVRAHGLLRIGPRVEGYDAGTEVEVELLEAVDLHSCIVVAGPPDPTTAALEERLAHDGAPLRFSHLSLAPHDAFAAFAAGESHVVVLDERDAVGDRELPRGARVLGRVPQVLVSSALLRENAGRRLVAALSE